MPANTTNSKLATLILSNDLPNENVVYNIDNGRIPFRTNKFYMYNTPKLAAIEYNRCVDFYNRKVTNTTPLSIMQIISRIVATENDHKETLEKLAETTIRNMYGVPEHIILNSKIKKPEIENFDPHDELEQEKQIDKEKLPILNEEIEKRRILNGIVHGASVYQWTSAFHIVSEELDKINPTLLNLYERYSATINYFNWKHNLSSMTLPLFNMVKESGGFIQGTNKIDFNKKEINADGLIFPLIIHELSKGVLEYIIAIGLPNHLAKHEIKYILSKADDYSHEFWLYYLGPGLWKSILETANVLSVELPKLISAMARMEYEELYNFCIDITFYPDTTGKEKMNKLKKQLNIKS